MTTTVQSFTGLEHVGDDGVGSFLRTPSVQVSVMSLDVKALSIVYTIYTGAFTLHGASDC